MKIISAQDLVCMNDHVGTSPIVIDLVYAHARHPRNIFGEAIYRPDARLWLHTDLARITLRAAEHLYRDFKYLLELKDGLRPVESQQKMQETPIVKAHPEWAQRAFLSLPGQGGHPRGMAVDVCVLDDTGTSIDMGVPFDFFSDDPETNPAGRDYMGFLPIILEQRRRLEQAFVRAASELNLPLYPLPSEWWDFRFPKDIVTAHAPIYDADLPPEMRMTAE